ncbi:MAG: hypothetical protein ABEJ35_03205 [Halobacteriaceae archaeon]
MRRRALLGTAATLTAGMAGCSMLGLGGDTGDETTTTAPPESTTTTAGSGPTQTTTDGEGPSGTTADGQLGLLPQGSEFQRDWQRETTDTRDSGVVGTYSRETDDAEWTMSVRVRSFDTVDTARQNIDAERERLASYVGVKIREVGIGDEAFGVSRTQTTAECWAREGRRVVGLEVETDYNFQGGGPTVTVDEAASYAEAVIASWG